MEKELLNAINEILQINNKPRLDKLSVHLSLIDDIGLDSLDLAQLTVILESKFGIDIFEDEIVTSVDQVLEKLKN